MEKEADKLSERFLNFGAEIVKLTTQLSHNQIAKHLALQLFRSATSIGANYEEARGAESRQDFSHKIQIALKESRETLYWLKLINKSGMISGSDLDKLIAENKQICDIVAKSVSTVKQNLNNTRKD